jgi:hypothetical protein
MEYLNNSVCFTPGCNKRSIWAPVGTRDNRICGSCRNKLPEEKRILYKNVYAKMCEACKDAQPNFAIVLTGESYKTSLPTHCGKCIKRLPEEERSKYEDVTHKRCEACDKNQPSQAIVSQDKSRQTSVPTHCRTCVEKLSENDRIKYENVHNKRCEVCDNAVPTFAIVFPGESYTTTVPTHCGKCTKKLPKETRDKYEDVANKRCEVCYKTQATYAEDFKGYPKRFCGRHAPTHFVHMGMKPCSGSDGNECPRNNIIGKYKPSSLCSWCDPISNLKRYEIAVLDRFKELNYDIINQYPVYVSGRTIPMHKIDGILIYDDIVFAIEVDEKGGHHREEDDGRRMRTCDDYLKTQHDVPVAWIRIIPNIRGGSRVLGKGCDQFGDKAVAKRNEIINFAANKIDELLTTPESGVFYFNHSK